MASRFRLADPREYRRGVILGLTLAEILMLLVFLLLMSSGTLLARRNREIDSLQAKLASIESLMAPVMDDLRKHGIAVRSLDDLTSRLERVTDSDKIRQELAEAQSALAEARAEAAKSVHEADDLRARLERIPADKRQMADKAVAADAMSSMLSRAGVSGDTTQDKLRTVLARVSQAENANKDLTGQNEQMRSEIARVKGNGGSGMPYCWATLDGHPEYMLRVDLHDDDVVVSDVSPRPRPDDPTWQLLDSVPRGQAISIATLILQVTPLAGDAATKKCRYAVEAFDGTARTNKPGYKYLMGRLWSVFMVRELR
jgi:hypothetical protein